MLVSCSLLVESLFRSIVDEWFNALIRPATKNMMAVQTHISINNESYCRYLKQSYRQHRTLT